VIRAQPFVDGDQPVIVTAPTKAQQQPAALLVQALDGVQASATLSGFTKSVSISVTLSQ